MLSLCLICLQVEVDVDDAKLLSVLKNEELLECRQVWVVVIGCAARRGK